MNTNQLKRVFILAGFVLLGSQLFAQELFEIKVKLVKNDNQTTIHATGILLDSKTMEIVDENVSNDNGELIFENVKKGEYILSVLKSGFKKADTRHILIGDKVTVFNNSNETVFNSPTKAEKALIN
jgi:hypothetical protein